MRKKAFLCFILSLLLILAVPTGALASSKEYKDISAGAQVYSYNVARVFYENGTYSPDFWSAYASRTAYLINEKEYKYLLPAKAEIAVPEDISPVALADIILELYISHQNPKDVGGKDLPQILANMGKVDGTFGENLTAIEHAKILMALEWGKVAFFREAVVDHLVTYRGEGGLLVNADGKENVLSTAWGLMAASLSGYAEPFKEQLAIALKTSISAEGYFCSEVETPCCTVQSMAIVALCMANVNLASESYVTVLDALNSFQLNGGAFTETLEVKKADNAATNKAWTAAGLIKEMYTELENMRDDAENTDPNLDPDQWQDEQGSTGLEEGAQREFPTEVVAIAGGCLLLLVVTTVLGVLSKKQKKK